MGRYVGVSRRYSSYCTNLLHILAWFRWEGTLNFRSEGRIGLDWLASRDIPIG